MTAAWPQSPPQGPDDGPHNGSTDGSTDGPNQGPQEGAGPPPGPGVAPPFAAPPLDGRHQRVWLGIGAAVLAVVLFCGGGTAALIGFSVASTRALSEQSRTVITEYLDALGKDDFGKAYDLLCEPAQRRESQRSFEQRVRAEPEIRTYRVGEPTAANEVRVPVDVTYAEGRQDQLVFTLAAESTAGLQICGIS